MNTSLISTPAKTGLLLMVAGAGAAWSDTLTVGGADAAPAVAVSVPFRFANTNEIVGMQFDLVFPASQAAAGAAQAASATTNHRAESRELATGRRRIVVYSPTNQLLPDDLFLNIPLTLTAASSSGGPTLNVANLMLTDKAGRTFTPSLSFPPLDAWRRGQFTQAELDDAAISGDDRDPDGDGLPNLAEYLGGTLPKLAEPEKAAQPGGTAAGGINYLTLTWTQSRTATAALAEPQVSSNLTQWSTTGVTAAPTGAGDAQTAEWRATVERTGLKQFLRLNFKRTTAP